MKHIFHNTTFFTLPKIIESGRLKTEDGFISFSNTFPSKHLPFGDVVIVLNKERLDKKNIEFIELPYDTTDPKTFEFFKKNPDICNYFMEGKSKDDLIKEVEKEIENCKVINRPDSQKNLEKVLAAYKSADPLSHLKSHLENYEREDEILVKNNEITIVPDDIEFIIASSRTLTMFYPISNKIINKKIIYIEDYFPINEEVFQRYNQELMNLKSVDASNVSTIYYIAYLLSKNPMLRKKVIAIRNPIKLPPDYRYLIKNIENIHIVFGGANKKSIAVQFTKYIMYLILNNLIDETGSKDHIDKNQNGKNLIEVVKKMKAYYHDIGGKDNLTKKEFSIN
ncbi:MAG: hypothetical protein FIB08_15230 [Candidatus Methanoperedens sp.]|nr:hypothetical protein [Candidatus Methanoperedens sp.]